MKVRAKLFLYSLIFFFLIIISKLFYWQIIASEKFEGLADQQSTLEAVVLPQRGKILSADGTPIVINQKAYLVYAEPEKISDRSKAIKAISASLSMDEASVAARFDTGALWVKIADRIDEASAKNLEDRQIEGIGFSEGYMRYYPEGSMSAHLLGFVGRNSKGEDQGYFGIEGYYDSQLKGRNGMLKVEKDALGNQIISGNRIEIPSENGRDLVLSVNKTVQYIVEEKLAEAMGKYGAKSGTVIIMEPSTGAIIAMASVPSYDQGNYLKYPSEYFPNPAVAFSYEPGSTFKVLVAAAALNEGKITQDTVFEETGPLEIGNYYIKTWNQKYHGNINTSEVLQYSSNVGMVYIARLLGKEKLIDYIYNLGFGNPTGVDLQEETSPSVRDRNKWYEIDYATASFGQGIAVTPLQMIRAVAAIANGGKLMKPYFVKQIIEGEKTIEVEPKLEKQVFSGEVSEILTNMMVNAVESGETRYLKPKGLQVAGKTGTAQIPIKGHYDEKKTIASFVGFAPAQSPKFIMLVTLSEPSSSQWGSETAAPLFFEITKEILPHFSISN